MRLTPAQVNQIKTAVRQYAGKGAEVYLFGSQLDDAVKGGDIDLLVKVPTPLANSIQTANQIAAAVMMANHGRKVDVIIDAPNLDKAPIIEVALQRGMKL